MPGTATHQIAVMGAIGAGAGTIDDLAERLPISRHAIAKAAGKLIERSLLERLEAGSYRLTLTGRDFLASGQEIRSGKFRSYRAPPTYGDTFRQRAWAAMRLSGRFTTGDILTLAQREDDRGAEANLQKFVSQLHRAGYLVLLPTRTAGSSATSNGHRQWRLTRDTGDQAPRYLERQRAFRDRNSGEVFPCR